MSSPSWRVARPLQKTLHKGTELEVMQQQPVREQQLKMQRLCETRPEVPIAQNSHLQCEIHVFSTKELVQLFENLRPHLTTIFVAADKGLEAAQTRMLGFAH